jgi:hypothetical protein
MDRPQEEESQGDQLTDCERGGEVRNDDSYFAINSTDRSIAQRPPPLPSSHCPHDSVLPSCLLVRHVLEVLDADPGLVFGAPVPDIEIPTKPNDQKTHNDDPKEP